MFCSVFIFRYAQIYFAVVALDMLGALHEVDRETVIAYVYSLQIASGAGRSAGFIGSGYLGFPFCEHAPCHGAPCALMGAGAEELDRRAIMLEVAR